MTKDKDEKAVIRARMARTGESYAAARAQLSGESPSGGLPSRVDNAMSFTATGPVGAALKAAAQYGGGAWGLLLALRSGDSVAARVLAQLGLEGVAPNDSSEITAAGQASFPDRFAAGTIKDVLPAAAALAASEHKKVLDSALLLRAAVAQVNEIDVPRHRLGVLVALRAADLTSLCAAAERQHGSEDTAKEADGSERTGMFERFTDKARSVIVLAQEEARGYDHNWIGTEHLLLGLLHLDSAVAAKVLTSLGVSLDQTRQRIEQLIGRGDEPPSGHIPFTPRAKTTLEESLRAALELNHNYIGTEHLLLGLLASGDGVATAVLLEHEGVTRESVHAEVIEVLKTHGKNPEPPPA